MTTRNALETINALKNMSLELCTTVGEFGLELIRLNNELRKIHPANALTENTLIAYFVLGLDRRFGDFVSRFSSNGGLLAQHTDQSTNNISFSDVLVSAMDFERALSGQKVAHATHDLMSRLSADLSEMAVGAGTTHSGNKPAHKDAVLPTTEHIKQEDEDQDDRSGFILGAEGDPTLRGNGTRRSTSAPSPKPSRHLVIEELAASVTEQLLRETFDVFGNVESVRCVKTKSKLPRAKKRPCVTGYIDFEKTEDAIHAQDAYNGGVLRNSMMFIEFRYPSSDGTAEHANTSAANAHQPGTLPAAHKSSSTFAAPATETATAARTKQMRQPYPPFEPCGYCVQLNSQLGPTAQPVLHAITDCQHVNAVRLQEQRMAAQAAQASLSAPPTQHQYGQGRPQEVLIYHLPLNVAQDTLERNLGRFGRLIKVDLLKGDLRKDRGTKAPWPIAVVVFEKREDAQRACDNLLGKQLAGKPYGKPWKIVLRRQTTNAQVQTHMRPCSLCEGLRNTRKKTYYSVRHSRDDCPISQASDIVRQARMAKNRGKKERKLRANGQAEDDD